MTSLTAPGTALAPRVYRALLAIAITAGIALAAGAITPFAQQYLPDWLRSLANSSGSWAMIGLLAVYVSRARGVLAAVLGIAALVLLNEAYAVVSTARGFYYAGGLASEWTFVAIVAGPIIGLAASWLRWSRAKPLLVTLAVAAPSAVLIGEGVFGLTVVAETTSPVYWWLQIAGGVAFVAIVSVRMLRRRGYIALAAVLTLTGAALFLAFYSWWLPALFEAL
jgi:hypothetical protein